MDRRIVRIVTVDPLTDEITFKSFSTSVLNIGFLALNADGIEALSLEFDENIDVVSGDLV
ncbi:MAG: hypothetical protein AB8B96_14760 [Lysobacterales bacterium]